MIAPLSDAEALPCPRIEALHFNGESIHSKCKEMLRLWEQDPCRINNQKGKAKQELMSKPRIADEMKAWLEI